MAHCPESIVIEIFGIEEVSCGRSCVEHNICGCVVDEDVVVLIDGIEETGIADLPTMTMTMMMTT